MTTISVPRAFSEFPGGRYRTDGPWSGQAFREDILMPALESYDMRVVVSLDGARGYPSSWLDEAFGAVPAALQVKLIFVTADDDLFRRCQESVGRLRRTRDTMGR